MHLADAFIQSDLQYIQVIHFFLSVCKIVMIFVYHLPIYKLRLKLVMDRSYLGL